MNYIIKEETINAILSYLSLSPYKDVAGLIALVREVKPVEGEETPNKKQDGKGPHNK